MRIKNPLKINLIKTIFFNLKYLPLNQAVKLPIYVYRDVRFNRLKGNIQLNAPQVYRGMIKIGNVIMGNADPKYQRAILEIDGTIVFNGKATIGLGTKISIKEHASLFLGNNIWVTGGNTTIICNKNIMINDDCLLSWDILLMDTDFHKILNSDNTIINKEKPIHIGKHVWIGCRTTILKGVSIANNNVIAANSTITKSVSTENCIIGRNTEMLKTGIEWKK